jgi:gluconokinase
MKYPCSAYDKVAGIVYFARMLDKIRLKATDELPAAYHSNLGTGLFDLQSCIFLGVSYASVCEQVGKGGTDDEILAWCFLNGRKPNENDVMMWNAFMTKKGFRDDYTDHLNRFKAEGGLSARAEIQTLFDYYEFDEGRAK